MTLKNALGMAGIHHVAVRVADLDTSLTLYRDTLGFSLTTAFSIDGRRFALLEAGNSGYIELVETPQAVHAARPDDVLWHFAVRVDDIDRAVNAVGQAGYTITRPVK